MALTANRIPLPDGTPVGGRQKMKDGPEIVTAFGAVPSDIRSPTEKAVADYVSGRLNWVTRTASYLAAAGDPPADLDTSGGAFTVTLPASPAVNTALVFGDPGQTWSTQSPILARNGSKIDSLAEDLVLNVAGASFLLIYKNSAVGWAILRLG